MLFVAFLSFFVFPWLSPLWVINVIIIIIIIINKSPGLSCRQSKIDEFNIICLFAIPGFAVGRVKDERTNVKTWAEGRKAVEEEEEESNLINLKR